jgi:hypothetical protein
MVPSGRNALLSLVVAAWLASIATGFAWWEAYEATPGQAGRAIESAPSARAGWELVLFAHPECPCTRASLTELAKLIHASGPSLKIRVAFVQPDGAERTDLWNAAIELPGVQVVCDPDGVEAKRVGAATSGHVVVFDSAGRVAFSGGIPSKRGRTGESVGRSAILALLSGAEPLVQVAPTFGCPLFGSGTCGVVQNGGVGCRW